MRLKNDIFFAEVEHLLSENRDVEIMVRGNSMRPLLRDNRDRVVIRPSCPDDICCGAIMLFRHRGQYVMHRVLEIDGDRITFAGDGNYKLQEVVTRNDVVARVVAVVRPSDRRIDCDSRQWRIMSRGWLILPPMIRRIILGVFRRLKI